MLKFDHLFKSSDITSSASKTGRSSEDTASGNHHGEVFKAIFEGSTGSGTVAKNGNILPPSSPQQQANEHRNLIGGSALILEGSKPTDESIAEFAALQGIDPNVIALIMGDSSTMSASNERNSDIRAENVGTNSDFNNNLTPNLLDMAKVSQGKAGIAERESKSIVDLQGRNLLGGESLNKEALFIGTQNKTVERSSKLAHKTIIKFQNAVPTAGVQKLDMINLGVDAEEILSLLSSSGAGSIQASLSSPVRADTLTHLIANPMPDLRVDLTAKSFAETQANTDQQQLIRRQDQYLEISRRLTEALGERLTAQISKGAWRVEMDLHPRSLGRIEINLEMKNGALEAYFNPSQNVTRELLQDTFEKLKDTLAQHGIDSAYVGLGSGKKQHSDGNPTDDTLVAKRDAETESDNLSISSSANKTHLSADGLDIQV